MPLIFWKKAPLPPADEDCVPAFDGSAMPAAPSRENYQRGPRAARWLKRCLRPLEDFFDAWVGEELNPVYKSGTLAVMFLALASASGLILIFYYSLSEPYASMKNIQSDIWLGRWVRAFHRYSSDATVIATGLHLLRMAAEGKAWGPRALAWISGVVLAGAVLFTAATGFVMVWDQHALELARSGARVADQLPLFSEPLSRAFQGASPPMPSFFFMNLFLHVALPLGLIFILWLHTSRLARSAWLPERKGLWLWAAALLGLSLLWPLALGPAADTLALHPPYFLDLFFTPWLPWSLSSHPLSSLALALGLGAVLIAMPWLWRPALSERPLPSHNDEAHCQGCVTCVTDCPFEAVSMVPRSLGQGSALVARVDAALCVSCGICVASCDRLSIGPADRIGGRQMADMQALGRGHVSDALVLIDCGNSSLGALMRARAAAADLGLVSYTLNCIGDLHPFSVRALQQHFKGVVIVSCPVSACQMREGATLARQRLIENREPGNKANLEAGRLKLIQLPAADEAEAWHRIQGFAHGLGLCGAPEALPEKTALKSWAKALAVVLPLLALLGISSVFRAGQASEQSALRLAWRLPGQKWTQCRDRSPDELAALLPHMRRKQICTVHRLSYRLLLSLDGKTLLNLRSEPRGIHGDSPLNIDQEISLSPGTYHLKLSFVPDEADLGQGARLVYEAQVELKAGRAALLALKNDGKTLEMLSSGR